MNSPIVELDGEIVNNPLPCFKCNKQLESAAAVVNQPYGGTVFKAYGQYGSTVFDPVYSVTTDKFIEITICDDCIKEAAENRKVIFVCVLPTTPQIEYQLFDPQSEY